MARALTPAHSAARRYVDAWALVAGDALGSVAGATGERYALVALTLAMPPRLRWTWEALADTLGVDVRTLRRDTHNEVVRALTHDTRWRTVGVLLSACVRAGIVRLAAKAATGDPEALAAIIALVPEQAKADVFGSVADWGGEDAAIALEQAVRALRDAEASTPPPPATPTGLPYSSITDSRVPLT